jgi:AraC-like DNA-binding protein
MIRAVCVAQADVRIIDAAVRLVELMAQPGDAELLAPLVIDEILIRLLRSPVGARIARIGLADTGVFGVEKAVTSMSPLQYQKVLRLQEARSLMLSKMMDAGSAGQFVGYVSASQFSREYGRFFGSTPTRTSRSCESNQAGSSSNSGGLAEGS